MLVVKLRRLGQQAHAQWLGFFVRRLDEDLSAHHLCFAVSLDDAIVILGLAFAQAGPGVVLEFLLTFRSLLDALAAARVLANGIFLVKGRVLRLLHRPLHDRVLDLRWLDHQLLLLGLATLAELLAEEFYPVCNCTLLRRAGFA